MLVCVVWRFKAWWTRMTWDPKRDVPDEYKALIAAAVAGHAPQCNKCRSADLARARQKVDHHPVWPFMLAICNHHKMPSGPASKEIPNG